MKIIAFHICVLRSVDVVVTEKPPNSRIGYYTFGLGVFWLCAGNDRLDVLPVGDLDPGVRRVLRRRTGIYSVDDNGRAVLAGPSPERHGNCGAGELERQFRSGHWIPKFTGIFFL